MTFSVGQLVSIIGTDIKGIVTKVEGEIVTIKNDIEELFERHHDDVEHHEAAATESDGSQEKGEGEPDPGNTGDDAEKTIPPPSPRGSGEPGGESSAQLATGSTGAGFTGGSTEGTTAAS